MSCRVHWANLCEGVWTSKEALAFAKAHPRVPRYNHQVRVPSTAIERDGYGPDRYKYLKSRDGYRILKI